MKSAKRPRERKCEKVNEQQADTERVTFLTKQRLTCSSAVKVTTTSLSSPRGHSVLIQLES